MARCTLKYVRVHSVYLNASVIPVENSMESFISVCVLHPPVGASLEMAQSNFYFLRPEKN
jgi:hypothetical protein